MPVKNPNKFMSLENLKRIRDNGYRSADSTGLRDYDASLVDELINEKQARKNDKDIERMIKEREDYER